MRKMAQRQRTRLKLSASHDKRNQQRTSENIFHQFGQRTKSVHGIKHLLCHTQSYKMRFLGCLAFFAALSMLIYMCYLLAERYQRKQYQSVIVAAKAPTHLKPFPVVIVCNKNRLNWSRLPAIKEKYQVPRTEEPLFENILTAYDALRFGYFERFKNISNEPLEKLNHINFTNVVEEMTWRCDELLENCMWLEQRFNCCDIFHQRRSLMGACLAFNENDRRSTAEWGPTTGLMVDLILRGEQHAPKNNRIKGFLLDIIEPGVWSSSHFEILPDMHVNIGINTVYHYYEENTRLISPQDRTCIFENERDSPDFKTLIGQEYMFENCLAECQQKYLMSYCGCTMDLFYPPGRYPPCKLINLPCLSGHNHRLQYFIQAGEQKYARARLPGMDCKCLYNCISLTLLTETQRTVMKPHDRTEGMPYTKLNVFYNSKGMLIYKTSLIYTWLDLLASFGGIFVLCLGCSIISLIEIGYFVLLSIPHHLWTRFCRRVN